PDRINRRRAIPCQAQSLAWQRSLSDSQRGTLIVSVRRWHMTLVHRLAFLAPVILASVSVGLFAGPAHVGPKPGSYWQVDDVRPGMKGQGGTVMKGTKIETSQAEILGVLKNPSPGRDLVLARLSGLGLDKTGVIAGMSGSPVYIENKLLGAVAYAWAFGKE